MLQAKTNRSALAHQDANGVPLMEGEEVHASLGVDESRDSRRGGKDIVLLTDKRVIHINRSGAKYRTSFAAIENITAVEITRQPVEGYGAFVWAALAFFVSMMLWGVIDNRTLSIAASVIVALMGVYLIIDRLTAHGEHVLVFRAGSAEIRTELQGDERQTDADALITRLFELKEQRADPKYTRSKSFAPR